MSFSDLNNILITVRVTQ